MKKIAFLSFLLFLIGTGLQAQDIITLKSGEDINAKIITISDNEIEYKKWDNQEGPTYKKVISDVFSIKYHNGQKEVFNITSSQSSTKTNSLNFGMMDYSKGNLYLQGHELSDYEISQYCGINTLNIYKSACGQRAAGKVLTTLGFVYMGVGLVSMLLYYADDVPFLIYGVGYFIPSQILIPLGFSLRGIGNGRIAWIANDFNSRNQISSKFDINLSPSILCTNIPTSSNRYCLGAALTFGF